ncbi:MAG: AmmeMemoRadiSam system radical SAM enzyme [Nanoarchaeota archaeon]
MGGGEEHEKECILYERTSGSTVQCTACAHRCIIAKGKSGICRVRKNDGGKLISLVYEKIAAENIDPIEKKPLFHFMPGTSTYSIGTVGCNFRCDFCQNFDIAVPKEIAGKPLQIDEIVENAQYYGCESISYTYNEPTIFIEMVRDAAKKAHEVGLKNVMVTNGYMTKEALNCVAPHIDAMNIDLKAYTDAFYKKLCRGTLQPVLGTIKRAHEKKIHIEITTLIIPGENDSEEEITKIAKFIAEIDPTIPWHISRFFPMYRMLDKTPTPRDALYLAEQIGKKEGLKHVYIGNI